MRSGDIRLVLHLAGRRDSDSRGMTGESSIAANIEVKVWLQEEAANFGCSLESQTMDVQLPARMAMPSEYKCKLTRLLDTFASGGSGAP